MVVVGGYLLTNLHTPTRIIITATTCVDGRRGSCIGLVLIISECQCVCLSTYLPTYTSVFHQNKVLFIELPQCLRRYSILNYAFKQGLDYAMEEEPEPMCRPNVCWASKLCRDNDATVYVDKWTIHRKLVIQPLRIK